MNHKYRLLKHLRQQDLVVHNFRSREDAEAYVEQVFKKASPWKVELEATDYGWKCKYLIDTLQSRSIQKTLRSAYSIKAPHRHTIIEAISQDLKPMIDLYVLRTDIANFFGSVNIATLVNEIESNHSLDFGLKNSIIRILNTTKCLPKGWGPSSVLSEIYMQQFDSLLITLPNVISSYRYVDDIVLIGTGNADFNNLTSRLSKLLPKGLMLNPAKTQHRNLSVNVQNLSFDYLGYTFTAKRCASCSTSPRHAKFRNVELTLSESKLSRLKTRIGQAFAGFVNTGESKELLNILYNLSHSVKLSDHLGLRKGIIHSYPSITCTCQLHSIDLLIKSLISKEEVSFSGQVFDKLSRSTRRELHRISFKRCYIEKLRYEN